MNAAYEKMEKDKGWKYDATLQFNGEQRLPSTSSNPEAFRLSEWVDAFTVVNSQITRFLIKNLNGMLGSKICLITGKRSHFKSRRSFWFLF